MNKLEMIFKRQQLLDNLILSNLNNRLGKDIKDTEFINEKFLALLVELGEFESESNEEKKKEEYADVLHFLVSIGNSLNLKLYENFSLDTVYASLVSFSAKEMILNLYTELTKFINAHRGFKYWSVDHKPKNLESYYQNCFLAFLVVGKSYNYSLEDIVSSYLAKWQININRQREGY